MKKLLTLAIVFSALLVVVPASAADTLYVDAAGICPGNPNCYTTIQAAINAANDGDTILVYPGIYDPQVNIAVPGWGGTYPAQGIVVWKANLTIQAIDPDPANTVIHNTLGAWMDWWRIQHLTGGVWVGPTGTAQTGGYNPGTSASPNAIMIVKSGVTIDGFTIQAHVYTPGGGYNGSGVLIGGVAPGDPYSLGADNNTVKNCVFSDVWQAVYIWHSSGNQIFDNTVAALGGTGHWAGISIYDGYNDAQIGLGHLSENNLIAHNTLADKGIALGAWAPSIWTSNAGSKVCSNTTTQVGVSYAHGPVIIGCSGTGFWQYETDNVIRITGITYNGTSGLVPADPTTHQAAVTLSAAISYDGSSDGSGVTVAFTADSSTAEATTTSGGSATATMNLPPGVYTVQAKVGVCESCSFTDSAVLVVYDSTGGFVTGGGWIDSPVKPEYEYMTVGGKASFGFVSKYKKGASVPDGNAEFQFKAGDLNFHSTSYQWLVVNQNYTNAQFKGYGTINGEGNYGFMIWAGDGNPDTFRIKIWDAGDETRVVYDNGVSQPIGGGSIVIHK
jgi:parallel beta-helix repeat protein